MGLREGAAFLPFFFPSKCLLFFGCSLFTALTVEHGEG